MTYSTLIIGAGAAGLAAGRKLADAGYDALILEARDRIGGRIHTDMDFADFPIELGAEFIHGDDAVTHDLLRQFALNSVPVVRMGNLWWAEAHKHAIPRHLLPQELQDTIRRLLDDYHHLAAANLPEDLSLADYLRQCGHLNLSMADVLLAETCCAGIDSLSCMDIQREMQVDHAGGGEARIRESYTALLNAYSHDLNIELGQQVTEVHWSSSGATVICDQKAYKARNCIVTIPISVLQRGSIRFIPSLPDDKQWAINSFHMEAATKLIYRFREQFWSEDLTFMAHEGATARWWTPGYQRTSTPILCTYVTSERAQQLDTMREEDALALGLSELSHLLAAPLEMIKAAFISGKRVSWMHEPFTMGGYAHVPPNAANCRTLLARPENDILFFAGEATAYDSNPQTVHGAIESGWRAADEVMTVLKR